MGGDPRNGEKKAKIYGCDKTLRKALKTRGIRFRNMRSKPRLTAEDIKARMAFAIRN